MKMYFATNFKSRSETKAVGDIFTAPILMTYIYGRADAKLFTAVRFVHKAYYIAYSCKNKLQLPNYDFQKCIWRVSKSSTGQLCCSPSSLTWWRLYWCRSWRNKGHRIVRYNPVWKLKIIGQANLSGGYRIYNQIPPKVNVTKNHYPGTQAFPLNIKLSLQKYSNNMVNFT